MDEKDFEILKALSECRNITKASEQLYITQSALSKRIRALERELGIELLIRSHQGIRFTPAGEAVLAHSGRAANEMEMMRRDLDSMQDQVCGTLNAGISINFAQYTLPDILAEYHARYPLVRLQISTGSSRSLYKQISDGMLDLAVLRGEYPWDGMRFLLSIENICLVHNRELEGKPLGECLYISHRTDSVQSGMISRWMNEHGLDPRSQGFCVDNITTCLEMVRRGIGWALLPEIALKKYEGCITPCRFSNGEPFVRRTYILCQQETLRLPQVKAFADLLKSSH